MCVKIQIAKGSGLIPVMSQFFYQLCHFWCSPAGCCIPTRSCLIASRLIRSIVADRNIVIGFFRLKAVTPNLVQRRIQEA